MNKRWYVLFIMLLVGAFVLVACGAPQEATEAPTTAPAEVDTAATEAAMHAEETTQAMDAMHAEETKTAMAAATEIPAATLRIWADDTRAPILVSLGEEFKAAYNVELAVEQVADIRDQFTIAAPAGEGPDIIIGAHDWIGQLIASGLLAPIDLGAKADQFTELSLKGFTYEGKLYGMPYATENLAFFYNTDLVDSAPATWDDVIKVGTELQAAGKADYAIALSGTTYDAFPLQTAFGGYIFGRNDQGDYDPTNVGIDSAGMIAAGDFLATNITSGAISNSTDWDSAHQLFEAGKIPFIMAGPWALDRIRNSGVPYAITNFPAATQPGQSFAGVQGFMVNALSNNVTLAQAFLTEFVATDDIMTQLANAGNRPSAFASVLAATADPDLAAFGQAGADAVLMPAIPEMGTVWGSWDDAFTLIINGDSSATDALTNAAKQIRELIAGAAAGMVNVPGSWQIQAGCANDWDPACETTALTDNGDGTYSGTFTITAGDYEAKVALDGSWTTNYGVDGKQDGDNYKFTVAADGPVTFTFDSNSKLLDIKVGP